MPCGTKKEKRQYRHILDSYRDKGVSKDKAEEIAARTVKKKTSSYAHLAFLTKLGRKR
jgi:hypothetical protein